MGKQRVGTIFWFRRDLRLKDNIGLYQALRENETVLPIFIFDRNILDRLEDQKDRRVDFIHQALQHLKNQLWSRSSDIHIFHGNPIDVFKQLLVSYDIKKVYCNRDDEPYARERDAKVSDLLRVHTVEFFSFKDQCIFDRDDVIKDDGTPYTVFTPYSKKWKSLLRAEDYRTVDYLPFSSHFLKLDAEALLPLATLGFKKTDMDFDPAPEISKDLLIRYKEQRDFPSVEGTSRLSVHLRFGTVSVRGLVALALKYSESWLNELIWREFYKAILWHFPHVAVSSFKPAYDRIEWRNREKEFELWCAGKTGFPIVDAGMRELNATGFMHNRVRMVASSFLVKDLLIDWRWGEAYFASKLNDFDLSANNGGWQWAAGSGCDAAPYFRIFNPSEQQKIFDQQHTYIKTWIEEWGKPEYPKPMCDHTFARKRTLSVYQNALNGNQGKLTF